MPKCPKCESTGFQIQEIDIAKEEHRYKAVVCRSCGSIVSVLPAVETNSLIREFALRHGFNLS